MAVKQQDRSEATAGQAAEAATVGADDALLAKLDQGFPPAWIAKEEGATITGAFLRLETGRTQYGPCPVVILGTSEGEQSVFLFYESLKSGLLRAQPEPGEPVAIRYEGELPVKNPMPGRKNTFHSYRVVVDRPTLSTKPVDWNAALGGDALEQSAPAATQTDEIPY